MINCAKSEHNSKKTVKILLFFGNVETPCFSRFFSDENSKNSCKTVHCYACRNLQNACEPLSMRFSEVCKFFASAFKTVAKQFTVTVSHGRLKTGFFPSKKPVGPVSQGHNSNPPLGGYCYADGDTPTVIFSRQNSELFLLHGFSEVRRC